MGLLADGVSVGEAALAIGCSRQCVYGWRAGDNAFRQAWDAALDHATEAIESVLYNKAKGGDLLAVIFWLKAHRPAIYYRRQIDAPGGNTSMPPIALSHSGSRKNVHFYIPINGRDQPEQDEVPTIEAERDEGEAA